MTESVYHDMFPRGPDNRPAGVEYGILVEGKMKYTAIFLTVSAIVHAQGVITTFAGTDWVFNANGKPAASAPLGIITGMTVDPAGNPVFVDYENCMIDRLNPDGTLAVLAGTGCIVFSNGTGSTGDGGPATRASLRGPHAVAYDKLGNLYVTGLYDVRKISPSGVITTIVQASQGQLFGVAVDASGTVYYSELSNNRVRKVTAAGVVLTVAGQDTGAAGSGGDNGPAVLASLSHPDGLALDNLGNLYIADNANFRIRKVTTAGIISTVVTGIAGHGIAFDGAGSLYIGGNYAVYKLPPGSIPMAPGTPLPAPIAGNPTTPGFSGDGGPAVKALFGGPLDVAPDSRGNLYIADWGNSRVRQISTNGTVATVAGNGQFRIAPDGVPALDAPLNTPGGLAFDALGNFYFTQGNQVSKVDTNGILTTVAGTGQAGNTGDGGPATDATLRFPGGLAVDAAGNIYIADTFNSAIRKVNLAGIISTFAPISSRALAFDRSGNLYVSGSDSRVRIVDPSGHASIYAGNGSSGYTGDGGPALNAALNLPAGLVVDPKGNLYISDSGNNCVRMVTPQGTISTIAGTGAAGRGGDGGPAVKAQLNLPSGLAMDASGNLYISDVNNIVVRRVTPSGIISTFAGGGAYDQLSDGKPANLATFYSPGGIAVDAAGDVFIADAGSGVFGYRIREVLAAPPAMQVSPSKLSLAAASGGAPVTQNIAVTGSISGLQFQVQVSGTGPANWLTVDSSADVTPRLLTLTADPTKLAPGPYTAVVTITPVGAVPPALTVNVTFSVGPALSPALSLDQPALSFTLPQGSAARVSTIQISNTGGQTLTYTAAIHLDGGGNWLAVSPTSGSASPGKPSTLTVTANPSGLASGTYTSQITIQSNAGSKTIPVIVTVSSNPQAVLLTQTGLSFTAVARGGVVPPQTFGVINAGTGVMNWQAGVSTTDRATWLQVSPASGSTDAAAPAPQVTVTVNASALAAGKYYGTVRIDAPGTANRSRLITVFLNVLPAGTSTAASVQPSELVFYATPGGEPPGSQVLNVYNISAAPRRFTSARSSGGFQLFVLPDSGTLDPGQPSQVIVQPNGSFAAGTYTGTLTFQFSDGSVQSVKITVVSAASANLPHAVDASAGLLPLDAGPCVPTKPTIALKSLGKAFQVSAGWPVGLSVEVSDNCQPWVAGSGTVVASFDDGDDQVVLTPLGDGTWQGTWKPLQTRSNVTVTITAQNSSVSNSDPITGTLASPNDQPLISLSSIGAVFATPAPGIRALAPGTFLAIYAATDARLADYQATASPVLPVQLANTQVFFDLIPAPVYYASETQLDVVVPNGVTVNTSSQIRIQRGLALSDPVAVDIAGAEPTVFQTNGNAWLMDTKPDNSAQFVVTPDSPAAAGDILQMYCVGLGVTDQQIADGAISPGSPLANVPGVTVNIGGQNARVFFAGLSPGFVGLYQINAFMPSGVSAGSAVPMTVTVAGRTSPAVNMAVR
jgi:trimeric autotransporter adhesin